MVTVLKDSKHNYERMFEAPGWVQGKRPTRAIKAMPARWSKLAFGIDISHYQKITAAGWGLMKDMAKLDFVFAKCSEGIDWIDPSFAGHVQGAYDVDIPMFGYHYFKTGYYVEYGMNVDKWPKAADDKQLNNLKKAVKNKKLYGVMLDIEDTSESATWTAFASGVFAGRVRDWLNQEYGQDFLLIDYLGEWMWKLAPDQFSWLVKHPLSIAKYPYVKGYVTTTWDDLKEKYFPPGDTTIPTLCCSKWDWWQFSGDKFIVPGITNQSGGATAVDLQFYNGAASWLYKRIKFVPKSEPNPPPLPPVEGELTLDERVTRLERVLAAMVEASK
jgi:GH25 family lysozyme M1 (1,4-beta-N-acetylmuramidase)